MNNLYSTYVQTFSSMTMTPWGLSDILFHKQFPCFHEPFGSCFLKHPFKYLIAVKTKNGLIVHNMKVMKFGDFIGTPKV